MNWQTWVILGIMVLAFVAMFIFNSKKRKKEEAAYQEQLNRYVEGAKILTIGGIMGEIVEVAEKYVVIATGLDDNKSYVKIDKRGISGILEEETPAEPVQEEVKEEVEVLASGTIQDDTTETTTYSEMIEEEKQDDQE